MKKLVKTKIASLLAVLMIISLATPLIAAAQIGFKDLQYDAESQVVSGTVYSSVYLPSVSVGVYGLSVTDVTYATYADGTQYDYNFSYNVADWNEDFINFWVFSSVYGAVYYNFELPEAPGGPSTPGVPGYPGGPGSGGGSGNGNGGSDNDCTLAVDNGTITLGECELTAETLEDAFAESNHVTIIADGYSVVLPAAVLKEIANEVEGAVVTIVTEAGTYSLPLNVFEYDALAESLEVDLADLDIRIEIKPVDEDTAEAILNRAEEKGLEVEANAVDFAVVAVADDNELEINSFGNTFVERSIPLHESVDSDKTTGVVFDPETGEFNFVPSIFAENDGEWQAIIKRNSNSIYTVVSGDKSFSDIPENHWGKEEIEVLANKLIVAGMTETTFAPNREVTRAEFTALLVRSLGLRADDASETSFDDVDENAWYAAEIKAAVDAGLVFGYKEDGTFRPNAEISRQEIASLVVRAMAYAGSDVEVTAAEEAAYLGQFTDSDVLHWGQGEMAAAIKAGVVHGMGNDTLAPKDNATRAQGAGLINRYLVHAEFINE